MVLFFYYLFFLFFSFFLFFVYTHAHTQHEFLNFGFISGIYWFCCNYYLALIFHVSLELVIRKTRTFALAIAAIIRTKNGYRYLSTHVLLHSSILFQSLISTKVTLSNHTRQIPRVTLQSYMYGEQKKKKTV